MGIIETIAITAGLITTATVYYQETHKSNVEYYTGE